jgi:predicted nucleic acid-binding Zn ribbon protein
MPVYLYRNLTTNETFELEQRISEPALTRHPETGEPVKRLIQPVGIAFKGSGFYVTDSRSKKDGASKPAGKTETPAAAKTDATSKTDTTSKPAGSAESKSSPG